MIEDTIARIEERLSAAQGLDPAKREELERLLGELRREAASLPRTIARRHEANEDVHGAMGKLGEAVTEFKTTHPRLVAVVNRISTILANMGI